MEKILEKHQMNRYAYLEPKVHHHVKYVLKTLFTFVSLFASAIMLTSTVGVRYWEMMMLVSFIGSFVSIIATIAVPKNKIYVASLVPIFMGIGTSPLITLLNLVDESIVVWALIGTLVIFGTLFGTSLTSSTNSFYSLETVLYSSLTTLIYGGLFVMITGSELLEGVVMTMGLLTFCGFILYDTNMMITRAYERTFTEEEAEFYVIMDSLNLFLDFVNLFIRMCQLVAKAKRSMKKD